jgi:hypothetical protein
MRKQTAVEWLEKNINLKGLPTDKILEIVNLLDKAKTIEKQQIIKAYDCTNSMAMYGEDYYNETFKPGK